MQTSNPAFAGTIFGDWAQADRRSDVMTVRGTAVKALALLAIVFACAAVTWNQVDNGSLNVGVMYGAGVLGFVFALVTMFKKQWAGVTGPIYAGCEGVFLGGISYFMNVRYPGIVPQAVAMTMATTAVMLFIYATGLIKVTGRLTACVCAGTGALALFYGVSFLLSMFHINGGVNLINSSSPIGIGISLIAIGLAAFNLLLDFDFIEKGASYEAPKYLEWYGAFGLMVTLVWLYVEILNLLRKLQDRR